MIGKLKIFIFPPPLAGEGREGGRGGNARACVDALPPPAALRAAVLPRTRERQK